MHVYVYDLTLTHFQQKSPQTMIQFQNAVDRMEHFCNIVHFGVQYNNEHVRRQFHLLLGASARLW
jgi:hypothetical protein